MLKGKSKAFKPKGPVRRPGAGPPSAVPSKAPTRESTTEPTNADATKTAKRKEREDDSAPQPPAKRVATPPPSETSSTPNVQPSPTRSSPRKPIQRPLPTPPPTQSQNVPSTSIPAQVPAVAPPSPEVRTSQPSGTQPPTTDTSSAQNIPSTSSSSSITQTSTALTPPMSVPPTTTTSSSSSPTTSRNVIRKAPVKSRTNDTASHKETAASSVGTDEPSSSTQVMPVESLTAETNTGLVPVMQQPGQTSTLNTADTVTDGGGPSRVTSLGPSGGMPTGWQAVNSKTSAGTVVPSLGAAGDVGNGAQANIDNGGSQLVQMAALNPDGTPGGIIETPQTQIKKKRVVKTKKKRKGAATQADDHGHGVIDVDAEEASGTRGRGSRTKKPRELKQRKERRERSGTPSDAEEQTVDTAALTMSDLCKDLRIGKKFSRHDDIKQREDERKAALKARREAQGDPEMLALLDGLLPANGPPGPAANSTASGRNDPANADDEEDDTPEVARPAGQSVMMRIVDGQIVIDERTLQVDRHRLAQEDAESMDIIEENDFTRIITSGTYLKREANKRWDWAAMDKFYNGLRSFGTDFGLIANMFPGRTRRQVKLLFNREERANPELIKRTLAGQPVPINLEEYTEMSGKTYVELSEIAAESQALDDQHKADLAAIEKRKNVANKRKKDAIHGRNSAKDILDALSDDDDEFHNAGTGGTGAGSSKENRPPSATSGRSREASMVAGPGRKGKRGGKPAKANKHSMRAGGDVVEVVGSIE